MKEIGLGERLLQVPDTQATVAAIGGVSVDWIDVGVEDGGWEQDGFEFRNIQNGGLARNFKDDHNNTEARTGAAEWEAKHHHQSPSGGEGRPRLGLLHLLENPPVVLYHQLDAVGQSLALAQQLLDVLEVGSLGHRVEYRRRHRNGQSFCADMLERHFG